MPERPPTPALPKQSQPLIQWAYLRLLSTVASVVNGRRDAYHQGWEAVATQVIVLGARVLALEHLHQQQVEVYTF